MSVPVYSATELMQKTGIQSMREFRAWLRKHNIRCIDAPAGPIVAHESLLGVMGVKLEQNDVYDPSTTI